MSLLLCDLHSVDSCWYNAASNRVILWMEHLRSLTVRSFWSVLHRFRLTVRFVFHRICGKPERTEILVILGQLRLFFTRLLDPGDEFRDLIEDRLLFGHQFFDLTKRVQHGRVISPVKGFRNLW